MTDDPHRDPTRTEDVEEADVPTWCPKCGRRAGTCTCEPFKRLRKKIRDLRDRLEEVEEERDQARQERNELRRTLNEDENDLVQSRRDARAARRRADRLERVVQVAREYVDAVQRSNLTGHEFPEIVSERFSDLVHSAEALDSREDEGETAKIGENAYSTLFEPEGGDDDARTHTRRDARRSGHRREPENASGAGEQEVTAPGDRCTFSRIGRRVVSNLNAEGFYHGLHLCVACGNHRTIGHADDCPIPPAHADEPEGDE